MPAIAEMISDAAQVTQQNIAAESAPCLACSHQANWKSIAAQIREPASSIFRGNVSETLVFDIADVYLQLAEQSRSQLHQRIDSQTIQNAIATTWPENLNAPQPYQLVSIFFIAGLLDDKHSPQGPGYQITAKGESLLYSTNGEEPAVQEQASLSESRFPKVIRLVEPQGKMRGIRLIVNPKK